MYNYDTPAKISLLFSLSNIVSAELIPYEIIEDYQCGFRRNRSTLDQIFKKKKKKKKREYL